jgi:hypothetical protein
MSDLDRARVAAEEALAERGYVAPLDVLIGMRWLVQVHVDSWRQGRTAGSLDQAIQVKPQKIASVLGYLPEWATSRGLRSREVVYVGGSRRRHELQFTESGTPESERHFTTLWFSPELSEAAVDQVIDKLNEAPELVVIWPHKEWVCTGCGGTGMFLIMDGPGPFCMACAGLDHLEFLPSGDAGLTRRAKKASSLSAVVVRFSRNRKRYERQGLLVEQEALDQAKR